MLADALIILERSSDEGLSTVNATGNGIICVERRTIPMAMSAKYDDSNKIFFLLGKSNNAIKGKVIGRSPRDSGCESTAAVKEIRDKGKLLKIKYIESRKNVIHKPG